MESGVTNVTEETKEVTVIISSIKSHSLPIQVLGDQKRPSQQGSGTDTRQQKPNRTSESPSAITEDVFVRGGPWTVAVRAWAPTARQEEAHQGVASATGHSSTRALHC